MEDIIAYSIIVIITLAVIVGAILLRRRFVRSREQKLKLQQEQNEWFEKQNRDYVRELQERAKQNRINEAQNVTPIYQNLGNASAQNTYIDSLRRVSGGSGGTTPSQPVTTSSNDLLTGIVIGSLVDNFFLPTQSRSSSSDDGDSRKSSSSSWESSSSSDSSSSDSGPSSDW